MLSPIDIQKRQFKNSFSGYNKKEVDEFMGLISETLEENIQEISRINEKYDELKTEVEKYKHIEDTLSETLVVAKQTADELIASARKKEEVILKETDLKVDERTRKCDIQILELERKINNLKLKYESEKIRLRNFFNAQLALMDDEVPTIEIIQENSKNVLAKRQRAEVISESKPNLDNISQENQDEDDFEDDLPSLDKIKQTE